MIDVVLSHKSKLRWQVESMVRTFQKRLAETMKPWYRLCSAPNQGIPVNSMQKRTSRRFTQNERVLKANRQARSSKCSARFHSAFSVQCVPFSSKFDGGVETLVRNRLKGSEGHGGKNSLFLSHSKKPGAVLTLPCAARGCGIWSANRLAHFASTAPITTNNIPRCELEPSTENEGPISKLAVRGRGRVAKSATRR